MMEMSVEIDGNRIRYLEYGGSGSPLVLVHGLGASAERWERVVPLFEDSFRVIVPDLIGFGRSDKPLTDYTPDFFVDFFAKFLAASGVSHPYVIGSSLGGQIVAEYASEHSGQIRGLVLVSPAGTMKQSTPALDAYIMAAMYPSQDSAKHAFEMMEGSGRSADEEIVGRFVERMSLPNAKMAFMSTLLGLKNTGVITPKLASISVPTMLVWGSADPVIPISYADDFASSIEGCVFCRMDGCGHTPYVQEPHRFAEMVRKFLDGI